MSNLADTSVVFGSEAGTIEVYNRKEFAAAIQAVPHDQPVRIILHRQGKKPIVWRFNYKAITRLAAIEGIHRWNRKRHWMPMHHQIDMRLERLAQAVLKAEKGLFE